MSLSFVLTSTALNALSSDPLHHRVALMAADNSLPHRMLMLEFPNPAEISVNSRRITANLKGMKNKPGTIPPVNITAMLDRTPRLANRVDIIYSSGNDMHKKFAMQVVLLKTSSVDELVEKVKAGKRFSKESVLQKLQKPEDDEIELASFDLTLKDPLSYMRIKVPCRSSWCRHNQCFDAFSFLTINEQTPQWTCPVCHISIQNLDAVVVDEYFEDILQNVAEDVETILVDPLGKWSVSRDETQTPVPKPDATPEAGQVWNLSDTEDEAAALLASKTTPVKPVPAAVHKLQTESRASTPNGKRKGPTVCIDLTEDSDEEPDVPLKRVKQSDSMEAQTVTPKFSINFPDRQMELPSSAHAYPHVNPLSNMFSNFPPSNLSSITNGHYPSMSPKTTSNTRTSPNPMLGDRPSEAVQGEPDLSGPDLHSRISQVDSCPGVFRDTTSVPDSNGVVNQQPILPNIAAHVQISGAVMQDANTLDSGNIDSLDKSSTSNTRGPGRESGHSALDISPPIVLPGSRHRTHNTSVNFGSDDISDNDGSDF